VPRAGWVKPETDQRLSDHISIGVLSRVFPPDVVDRVVADAGRTEQRHRLLPARVVVYYVLGLALFSQCSYEEVIRNLVEGLSWADGWARTWNVPTKAALFKARARLGPEPIEALYRQSANVLATKKTRGAWYRGWRLMSVDGTCLDVADTAANDDAFGRSGSKREDGTGPFPQVRLVGLAECGTHAIVDAVIGRYNESEQRLVPALFASLSPGMLLLADRGFVGYSLWTAAQATGADLLWRTKVNHILPVDRRLGDGSFLSTIYPTTKDRRHGSSGVRVRVIEYTLDHGEPENASNDTAYRLLTTVLDARKAPADELASVYPERWEFETALDELKTHQRTPRVVLRSKMPDGVRQEVYGYLCVHYAIRWLMHSVAQSARADPDRLSFTRALRVARRTAASHPGFSP
jgi:Insertion element 4 transposase N-terminal/Transposase DDE domain